MKQLVNIFFGVFLLLILLVSCEDYYKPPIDKMLSVMVVESNISNDLKQNFVRLSKTRTYYGTDAVEWVSGANVELVRENFQIMKAREDVPGYYLFPGLPESGSKYKLRISYLKDVYESEYVLMPPVPKIDSLYTQNVVDKIYRTNGYNVPELFDRPGRGIYVDLPVTTELAYYRFSYRAILQWKTTPLGYFDSTLHYTPEDTLKSAKLTTDDEWPPDYEPQVHDNWTNVLYGWKAQRDRDTYNLAAPKEFSSEGKIYKHQIVSLGYNCLEYLDSMLQVPKNWIIILDEYGISKESYEFHQKLNQQFSAQGSLFDPVLTQVFGNVRCLTDPSKMVLGYFDLISYKQYRYYLNMGNGEDKTLILRRLSEDRFFDISDYGYNKDEPPVFWETDYK